MSLHEGVVELPRKQLKSAGSLSTEASVELLQIYLSNDVLLTELAEVRLRYQAVFCHPPTTHTHEISIHNSAKDKASAIPHVEQTAPKEARISPAGKGSHAPSVKSKTAPSPWPGEASLGLTVPNHLIIH
eukprot:870047-Amphidinium_carterae.2